MAVDLRCYFIYAITDARTLVFTDDGVKQIVTFNNKHFGPVEAKAYSKTRTDVLFRSSLEPESPGVNDGFWGNENGEMATKILEEKLEQAEARTVKDTKSSSTSGSNFAVEMEAH